MTSLSGPSNISPLPVSSPAYAEGIQLQFDVVKLDYERTLALIDGVTRTRATLRAATITAYVAFLGLAIQNKSWALAAGAGLLVVLLGLYDAYHAWLYGAALRRANALERLFQH